MNEQKSYQFCYDRSSSHISSPGGSALLQLRQNIEEFIVHPNKVTSGLACHPERPISELTLYDFSWFLTSSSQHGDSGQLSSCFAALSLQLRCAVARRAEAEDIGVTHRLLAIYFTVCTRSRVLVQKYLLGIKFTDSKARSRSLNLQ